MIITSSGCHLPTPRPWNGHEAAILRAELKVTQGMFADLLGVGERTIRRIEKLGLGYTFTSIPQRLMLDELHDRMAAARDLDRRSGPR